MYTDEEPIRQKVVKRIDEEITSVQSKPNVVSLEPVTTEVVTDIHLNVTTIQPTSNVDSVEQEPTTMAELVDRNVTTVQPKTDAAVMTHWSVVNVTCNCSQPAEVKNGKFDVTYVTQTSLNRFVLFSKEILSRWNGPLVISVCIRSEDELSQLQSFLEEAEFPPHFVVIPYLDTSDHYPINKLRNIAIEQVATSHYLMTDIDLFPAGDLYETILRIPDAELDAPKQAIVVPAYEVRFDSDRFAFMNSSRGMLRRVPPKCDDLEQCWSKHLFLIPHHKNELMSCLQFGPCKQFKEKMKTHVGEEDAVHL